jgi:hypothetical protein
MRHTSYSEVGNLPLGSKFYLEDRLCEVVDVVNSLHVCCRFLRKQATVYVDADEFVKVAD